MRISPVGSMSGGDRWTRRTALTAAAIAAGLSTGWGDALAAAPPVEPGEIIDLWPAGAPGAPAGPLSETIEERSADPRLRDRAVRHITRPRLAVFRPARPDGRAILVMPGGGYARLAIDREGHDVAQEFAAQGVTAFVLFYRLPGDGWRAGADVALSDAQRAVRLIRAHAVRYGIAPDRIAAMGFSAGGHVCGELATRFAAATYDPVDAADRASARPDVAALLYAVQSMALPLAHRGSRDLLLGPAPTPALERMHTPAANVTAATPPCFLVHAEDDRTVDIANTLAMRAALKQAGIPVETHLFGVGGHGFGLRGAAGKPVAAWPSLFLSWWDAARA